MYIPVKGPMLTRLPMRLVVNADTESREPRLRSKGRDMHLMLSSDDMPSGFLSIIVFF